MSPFLPFLIQLLFSILAITSSTQAVTVDSSNPEAGLTLQRFPMALWNDRDAVSAAIAVGGYREIHLPESTKRLVQKGRGLKFKLTD